VTQARSPTVPFRAGAIRCATNLPTTSGRYTITAIRIIQKDTERVAMNESGKEIDFEVPFSPEQKPCLPNGYRSGIITAITVVLGFSLLFLRSWVFELPGEWTPSGIVAAALLLIAIVLELISLWRSLQPDDENPKEYQLTLRWFMASTAFLLISLIIAGFSYAHLKS
jgi:hypothetical protein